MPRTITVKGIGRVTTKPDFIIISMSLESCDKEYDKAMEFAAENNRRLIESLVDAGFEKDSVKTTNFNVRTNYNHEKDGNGNFHKEFAGYVVNHQLKVGFDLDIERLSIALSAISNCQSHPQIKISFTVKDATALNEEMLRSATANARRKAEILCEASGVTLSDLIAIDYNWRELDIYSNTHYDMTEECLKAPRGGLSVEIDPEDIDIRDTATFVWEIK